MKYRIPLSDDRDQHRAVAAYMTDFYLAAVATRSHISQGYNTSVIVSIDNHCSFHTDEFRVDEWMLYECESPVSNNGIGFSLGRLWTHLLLSRMSPSRKDCQTQSLNSIVHSFNFPENNE